MRIILFRDSSPESDEAERLIKENVIDYVSLMGTDGELPRLMDLDLGYSYRRLGGIRLFVSCEKADAMLRREK